MFAGRYDEAIEFLAPRVGLCEDESTSQIVRDFAGLDRAFLAVALRNTKRFDEAIEQLEQALDTFAGTVLRVTHDRAFLDATRVTRRVTVDAGSVTTD